MIAELEQLAAADMESPLEGYMRQMFTHLLVVMARSLHDDGLSLAQLAALHLVDLRKQMRISDLATELGLQLPAASRLASELVDRGLLDRREDPQDRRAKAISLSEAGRALIEELGRRRVVQATASMSNAGGEVNDRFIAFYKRLMDEGFTSATPPPPAP